MLARARLDSYRDVAGLQTFTRRSPGLPSRGQSRKATREITARSSPWLSGARPSKWGVAFQRRAVYTIGMTHSSTPSRDQFPLPAQVVKSFKREVVGREKRRKIVRDTYTLIEHYAYHPIFGNNPVGPVHPQVEISYEVIGNTEGLPSIPIGFSWDGKTLRADIHEVIAADERYASCLLKQHDLPADSLWDLISAKANGQIKPFSLPWYAARVVEAAHFLRQALLQGAIEGAAWWGAELGSAATSMALKHQGKNATEEGRSAALQRKKERHEDWHSMAESIEQANPGLSNRAIARRIKERGNVDAEFDTIRRVIAKKRKARRNRKKHK